MRSAAHTACFAYFLGTGRLLTKDAVARVLHGTWRG